MGGDTGRASVLALCRAVFLITKPSVVQGDGGGAPDAATACLEMRAQFPQAISRIQLWLGKAAGGGAGAEEPPGAEGVGEAEWARARAIVGALDPKKVPSHARSVRELAISWHR